MRRLFLHIGLPKTGTSYIQNWLHDNKAALRNNGAWVPYNSRYAHRLAVEFITSEPRAARLDVVDIRTTSYDLVLKDFEAALNNPIYQSGVLSSEYFFECVPGDLAPLIEKTRGIEIVIILFLRRQDRLIESSYNQEVKAMGWTSPIGAPCYSESHDWLKLYEKWGAIFGQRNVRVVNFDAMTQEKRVLQEFLKVAELPASLYNAVLAKGSDVQNQSVPANFLEFKRLTNMIDFQGFETWLFEAMKSGIPTPAFRLAPEAATDYLTFYEESNRELSRRLNAASNAPLFPTYEAPEPGISADFTNHLQLSTVAQILMLQIKQSQEKCDALMLRIQELEDGKILVSWIKQLFRFACRIVRRMSFTTRPEDG